MRLILKLSEMYFEGAQKKLHKENLSKIIPSIHLEMALSATSFIQNQIKTEVLLRKKISGES